VRIARHSISTSRSDPESPEHSGIFSHEIDSLSPNFELFSSSGRTVWTNNIKLSDFSNLFSPLVTLADALLVRAVIQADGNKDFLDWHKLGGHVKFWKSKGNVSFSMLILAHRLESGGRWWWLIGVDRLVVRGFRSWYELSLADSSSDWVEYRYSDGDLRKKMRKICS